VGETVGDRHSGRDGEGDTLHEHVAERSSLVDSVL
jgi:hypothetical protein